MSESMSNTKNPNILTDLEVQELGLQEATEDMGPSWDEIEEAAWAKRKKHGKVEGTQTAD